MASIKYGIYPGTVTLYDGTTKTFTAEELASEYGLSSGEYDVLSEGTDELSGKDYMEYIHLKPRRDDHYTDIKEELHDDGQQSTLDEDFDGRRRWTHQTRRMTFRH